MCAYDVCTYDMENEKQTDLRGSQPDDRSQMFAFGSRQVPLLPEPALQLVRLGLAEQDAALAFFVHCSTAAAAADIGWVTAGAGRTGPVLFAARGARLVVEVVIHFVAFRFGRFVLGAGAGHGTGTAARADVGVGVRSVGRQSTRRARRVRQVRHPGRRAVRAGLLGPVMVHSES